MRIKISLALVFSFYTLFSILQGQNINPQRSYVFPKYRILKILERPRFYIIYANRNDSTFKILTEKKSNVKHTKIKLNKEYPLDLQSLFLRELNGVKIVPPGTDACNAIEFCGETILLEPLKNTCDIFIARNLTGLYLNEDTISVNRIDEKQ